MPSLLPVAAALLGLGLISACNIEEGPKEEGPSVALTPGTNIDVGSFDNVELRGGGHVVLRHGDAERVKLIAGSTQYTRVHIEDGRKLIIDACNADCPNHYDLEIEITAPNVPSVAIDGGGHIETAPGFPAQGAIAAAVNGGGHIDLGNLDVQMGTAAVHGGGHILIHADSMLTAAVDGGGSIRYMGNPQVTSAINGGGSIGRDND